MTDVDAMKLELAKRRKQELELVEGLKQMPALVTQDFADRKAETEERLVVVRRYIAGLERDLLDAPSGDPRTDAEFDADLDAHMDSMPNTYGTRRAPSADDGEQEPENQ